MLVKTDGDYYKADIIILDNDVDITGYWHKLIDWCENGENGHWYQVVSYGKFWGSGGYYVGFKNVYGHVFESNLPVGSIFHLNPILSDNGDNDE